MGGATDGFDEIVRDLHLEPVAEAQERQNHEAAWKRLRLASGVGAVTLLGVTTEIGSSDVAGYTGGLAVVAGIAALVSHSVLRDQYPRL